jgi:hypothetical protein
MIHAVEGMLRCRYIRVHTKFNKDCVSCSIVNRRVRFTDIQTHRQLGVRTSLFSFF